MQGGSFLFLSPSRAHFRRKNENVDVTFWTREEQPIRSGLYFYSEVIIGLITITGTNWKVVRALIPSCGAATYYSMFALAIGFADKDIWQVDVWLPH